MPVFTGCPYFHDTSALPTTDANSRDEEQEEERGPLVVIPYVAGMSEDIRRACRKFNIRVVFKFGWTLHLMLTKVKDTLPLVQCACMVYRIPCSCRQVYIGETGRRLETRLKEHRGACHRNSVLEILVPRAKIIAGKYGPPQVEKSVRVENAHFR